MLSFLNSAKNEFNNAFFVFTNFSVSRLIIINALYRQLYFLILYFNIIIPYLQIIQKNHHFEQSEFLESHPNY